MFRQIFNFISKKNFHEKVIP